MVGLLEGQRKADRAVQELVFLKFLLQLCAALKPSCRPEESEGFVQSLWQLPATCGRITQGDMPNCKNCACQSKALQLLVYPRVRDMRLFNAFSSSLCNRDEDELRWPGVQQVGLRDKFHMNNTDRTTCLRWVALGAMSLQAQLHSEHNSGLLPRSGSQAVK